MQRRLQIRRGEGWRLPANTLKVDRSSLCGNPFLAIELGDDRAIVLYRAWIAERRLNARLAAATEKNLARRRREILRALLILRGNNLERVGVYWPEMASPTGVMPRSCWPWPTVDRQKQAADDVLCASGCRCRQRRRSVSWWLGEKLLISWVHTAAPSGLATRKRSNDPRSPDAFFNVAPEALGCGCRHLSSAAAFAASAQAAAHSRGCANTTAAAFARTCTSQSRALTCGGSANRTLPDPSAPLADVGGRTLMAAVNAAAAPNIDTNRDRAVTISVVIVVIIPIGATVAIDWGVVAVSARGVGIAIHTRLSIAAAIIPIAGPSCACGKGEESQRGSGNNRKFAHQVSFLTW